MAIIDLSLPLPREEAGRHVLVSREVKLRSQGGSYTGMCYDFRFSSMAGTYIDFPGHIRETNDGRDAAGYPLEKLYRVDSSVIHLDRESGSGAIGADELQMALPPAAAQGGGLVINALGQRRFDEIEGRSVFLAEDALDWIIERKIHLLVADVYESRALHGVFLKLFAAGISTVCQPVNLYRLPSAGVKLTVLCLPVAGATQLPCRIVAETGGIVSALSNNVNQGES